MQPPPPPGAAPGQGPQQINNNMGMSILAIFLFWPLAIPAILNASKVNPALQVGDYATAQHHAEESKKWSKWAIIVGLSWIGLVFLCVCGSFVLAAASA
ncbi:MAG TPA: CD225/dispanin family protein [Natronosporangium sp.]|nr:CD225/dispanin family protein [Natronosporangium sp.]